MSVRLRHFWQSALEASRHPRPAAYCMWWLLPVAPRVRHCGARARRQTPQTVRPFALVSHGARLATAVPHRPPLVGFDPDAPIVASTPAEPWRDRRASIAAKGSIAGHRPVSCTANALTATSAIDGVQSSKGRPAALASRSIRSHNENIDAAAVDRTERRSGYLRGDFDDR